MRCRAGPIHTGHSSVTTSSHVTSTNQEFLELALLFKETMTPAWLCLGTICQLFPVEGSSYPLFMGHSLLGD